MLSGSMTSVIQHPQGDDRQHIGVVGASPRDSSILWHAAEETGDSRSFDAGGRKPDTHTHILLKVKRGVGGVWPWVRCGGCVGDSGERHFMLGTYRVVADGHADEGGTWKGVRRIADKRGFLEEMLMGVCGFGDGSKPRGMPFVLLRLSIACLPNSCCGIAYFEREDRGKERAERGFLVEPSVQMEEEEEEEGGLNIFFGSSSVQHVLLACGLQVEKPDHVGNSFD